jgi:hypothetical protein
MENKKKILTFLVLSVFCVLNFVPQGILASSNPNFQAEILPVCGNNIKETGEQCDGTDLAGASCTSLGFIGGMLFCKASCDFDTWACSYNGSGGGGNGEGVLSQTGVNFDGRAYPLSKITVLKDGQIATTTIAGSDANFNVSLTGLSSGNYTFSLYGEDNNGNHSALFNIPLFIISGNTATISGIFISPTISVDKSEVKKGDAIAISGQSVPQGQVIISVNSNGEVLISTNTDNNGVYLYNFDTSPLAMGQHYAKSKGIKGNEASPFSDTIGFLVSTETVFAPTEGVLKGDLNNDGRVNLVDFSIAAYWYNRPLSEIFKLTEAERLNGDEKIDLVDFSIMAYFWTG